MELSITIVARDGRTGAELNRRIFGGTCDELTPEMATLRGAYFAQNWLQTMRAAKCRGVRVKYKMTDFLSIRIEMDGECIVDTFDATKLGQPGEYTDFTVKAITAHKTANTLASAVEMARLESLTFNA